MRIPYIPAEVTEPREVVDAIRLRRGGALLNLDRMLLHSPPLARGWNDFFGEVRSNLILPAKLREIAMCVVAVLTGAHYEFHHHAPLLIAAGGNAEQVEAIRTLGTLGTLSTLGMHDPSATLFDAAESATIKLTMAMTRHVAVDEATFTAARLALGSEREVVELVSVIAAYNMVSRVLVAFEIQAE